MNIQIDQQTSIESTVTLNASFMDDHVKISESEYEERAPLLNIQSVCVIPQESHESTGCFSFFGYLNPVSWCTNGVQEQLEEQTQKIRHLESIVMTQTTHLGYLRDQNIFLISEKHEILAELEVLSQVLFEEERKREEDMR